MREVTADDIARMRDGLFIADSTATVIGIAAVMGTIDVLPVTAEANSQVADRISPRLIDLIAALDDAGLADVTVPVTLLVGGTAEILPGNGDAGD